MKTALLVGINAKFIHSNLAIRSIYEYTRQSVPFNENWLLSINEYSINQDIDYILNQIMEAKADIIGFSSYLWNIDQIRQLSRSIKLLMPESTIVYGGPEVSYTAEDELKNNQFVDYILLGEGEESFTQLLMHLYNHRDKPKKGIAYRGEDTVFVHQTRNGLNMDDLPFAYASGFEGLDNRILYYETSRGCPFNCQYCLSSIEKGVRFKSLTKVFQELDVFLNKKVRQVKFVDRTFNAKQEHALGIMEYIITHDNGVTNFHFEVAPELVNDRFIETLKKAREGLFQLEMGVQSTNQKTLEVIKRYNQFDKIIYATQAIQSLQNTHIHMDLIAGLPEESFERFGESFDFVYQLKPDQLQLGFLKVLKGSGMMAMVDQYDIVYRDYPPYEILRTHAITYEQLESLKLIEEMVELFYNSGQFLKTIRELIPFFETPFSGFSALAKEWKQHGMHHKKHQKLDLYEFLFAFIRTITVEKAQMNLGDSLIQRLAFDYCLNEKPKKSLPWMNFSFIEPATQIFLLDTIAGQGYWTEESSQFSTKQLSRMYHIDQWDINKDNLESYDFNNIIETTHTEIHGTFIVINYERRNFIDHSGEVICICVRLENVVN